MALLDLVYVFVQRAIDRPGDSLWGRGAVLGPDVAENSLDGAMVMGFLLAKFATQCLPQRH